MTIIFSAMESYFRQDGRPTALGQQLLQRLNQLFAAQDAALATTNADLVTTKGDLATTTTTATTTRTDLAALTSVVATKAPLAGPVFTAPPRCPSYLVAALPAAPGAGAAAYASDSTATHAAGLGLAPVGGGANFVPVYFNGSIWLIG